MMQLSLHHSLHSHTEHTHANAHTPKHWLHKHTHAHTQHKFRSSVYNFAASWAHCIVMKVRDNLGHVHTHKYTDKYYSVKEVVTFLLNWWFRPVTSWDRECVFSLCQTNKHSTALTCSDTSTVSIFIVNTCSGNPSLSGHFKGLWWTASAENV